MGAISAAPCVVIAHTLSVVQLILLYLAHLPHTNFIIHAIRLLCTRYALIMYRVPGMRFYCRRVHKKLHLPTRLKKMTSQAGEGKGPHV